MKEMELHVSIYQGMNLVNIVVIYIQEIIIKTLPVFLMAK